MGAGGKAAIRICQVIFASRRRTAPVKPSRTPGSALWMRVAFAMPVLFGLLLAGVALIGRDGPALARPVVTRAAAPVAALKDPLALFAERSPGARPAGALLSTKKPRSATEPHERVLAGAREREPAPDIGPDILPDLDLSPVEAPDFLPADQVAANTPSPSASPFPPFTPTLFDTPTGAPSGNPGTPDNPGTPTTGPTTGPATPPTDTPAGGPPDTPPGNPVVPPLTNPIVDSLLPPDTPTDTPTGTPTDTPPGDTPGGTPPGGTPGGTPIPIPEAPSVMLLLAGLLALRRRRP
jgi:hypothetical protein